MSLLVARSRTTYSPQDPRGTKLFVCLFSEIESHYVALAVLELTI